LLLTIVMRWYSSEVEVHAPAAAETRVWISWSGPLWTL
jgi:hypothetical protein